MLHFFPQKYFDLLSGGKSNLSILVPLCGKTLDITWICEKGHNVVGCDLSDVAAREFFEENNILYSTSGNLHTTVESSLNINVACNSLL